MGRPIAVSVVFVAAILTGGASLAQPEKEDPFPPAASSPAKPETVIVRPLEGLKVFDMQQCTEDLKHCEMATCVSTPTREGRIVLCQSHGTFFP